MLELPAVISLKSGRPVHFILIRVIYGCGAIWKMLRSVLRLHTKLNWRYALSSTFWTWSRRHCDQLWNMLFLNINFLQKTVDSILNMFSPVLRNLKTNLMDAFYEVFDLRTVKNRFFSFIVMRSCLGGWTYITNSITHLQSWTPKSIIGSTCNVHLSHYFTIYVLFVVEPF